MLAESTPERTAARHILAWLAFVLLVLYTIFIGGSGHGIYLVALRTASLAVIALILAGWFVVSLRLPHWRPTTAIWPTLVVPVAMVAFGTITSRFARLGLEYVAWGVLLVALYLLLVRIMATRFARDRIGGLAAMLALVLGVVYIGSVLVSWIEWWGLLGRLAVPPLRPLYAGLTLGSPGVVLAIQVLLTVVAYAGLGTADRGRRVVLALVTIISATVVILSGGRAGWFGLTVTAVVVGGVWVVVAWRGGRLDSLLRDRKVRLMATTAAVLALAAALLVGPAILTRLGGSSDGGRLQYFATALRMFSESPLLGTGPGTWAVLRVAHTEPGELDWYIPHAHDMYLQTMAELGILGLAAGLITVLPVGWLLVRGLRSPVADSRRWAWGGFFGLVFVAATGVFDFYMHLPAVLFVAAIPIAVLDATSEKEIGVGKVGAAAAPRFGRIVRLLFWMTCLAAVLVLARAESIAWTHQAAVAAANAGQWDDARRLADQAAAADSDMNAYQMTRGLAASGQEDWAAAADAYGRAAPVDDIPMSWLGLAQAQLELGATPAEVTESIERATRSGDRQAAVWFAAGHLYDRLGMTDAADDAYSRAIAAFPSLAADPFWTTDASLAPRYSRVVELTMEREPSRAWEIALMSGDAARARALNEGGGGSPLFDLVIEAWSGDAAAADELYAIGDARPGDSGLLAWAERIAARSGDQRRADRYHRLVEFAAGESGVIPGAEIRVDRHEWLRYVPAGTVTWYAGQWLYRRPTTLDLIPPGLPRLVHAARGSAAAAGP